MGWLILRVGVVVLAVVLGGLLGHVVAQSTEMPTLGVVLGSVIGAALLGAVDGLRGRAMMRWLRGLQDGPAPRGAGFWGEIGYRVERSIRMLERDVANEQTRLLQFRSAIEASPNGVLLLDAGDCIEWCNGVAADHFGIDPHRDRRQRVTNLVRAPAFVGYLQTQAWDAAVTMPDPRGKGLLSVVIRPYGEAHKLVLSQDITEREQSDAMRRNFVANVSHELRTPLTVLSGFIETMSSLVLTDAERHRVLSLMGQQAQRMQALVNDLLTLATLEGSPRPPVDRWVALGRLLAQAQVDATALSAGRHKLRIEGDAAVQIAGNEGELASAIGNLVNNAVRYTPEGGQITVSFQLRPGGGGELAVSDTGIGVEREHLPRLTERFYRVDSSRSRDSGGTGLGLSIVKHVVQRHGGELDIHSEPGKGSRFGLRFPAARIRFLEPAPDPRDAAASAA
jgi:two-component system, OmpR family, phosphate regulon sensor histidine kinase PhoR